MKTARIHILTPVHVGSGVDFKGNFEYLFFEQEKIAVVLDQEKVLDILDEDESMVSSWVNVIDNKGSLLKLLQQRKSNLQPSDVALRELPVRHAGLSAKTSLREQLHDGMGIPLMPGSSIKGAVRTALFAQFISKNDNLVKRSENLKNRRGYYGDQQLIKKCFGDDPNHDILRLLQIGDANFERTEVFSSDIVNLFHDGWGKGSSSRDKDALQFIEAIPAGLECNTPVSFHLDEQLFKIASDRRYFLSDISQLQLHRLIPMLNEHTKGLVKKEIAYWQEEGNPPVLENYLEELDKLLNIMEACSENECVIRLGWGTGFRNMTGAWHSALTDEDYYSLVKSMRKRHPEDMVFPKSTRLLRGGVPLGFVKLTV